MKHFFLCNFVIFAMCSVLLADASSDVKKRAMKMESRVQKDLQKGALTQIEANKIDQQLGHIERSMVEQGSTSSLRRATRTKMDKLDAYLTKKESGQPTGDSVLGGGDDDSESQLPATPGATP